MITWLLMHVGAVGQWRMRAVCKIFRTLALKMDPVAVSDSPGLIDRERKREREAERERESERESVCEICIHRRVLHQENLRRAPCTCHTHTHTNTHTH